MFNHNKQISQKACVEKIKTAISESYFYKLKQFNY